MMNIFIFTCLVCAILAAGNSFGNIGREAVQRYLRADFQAGQVRELHQKTVWPTSGQLIRQIEVENNLSSLEGLFSTDLEGRITPVGKFGNAKSAAEYYFGLIAPSAGQEQPTDARNLAVEFEELECWNNRCAYRVVYYLAPFTVTLPVPDANQVTGYNIQTFEINDLQTAVAFDAQVRAAGDGKVGILNKFTHIGTMYFNSNDEICAFDTGFIRLEEQSLLKVTPAQIDGGFALANIAYNNFVGAFAAAGITDITIETVGEENYETYLQLEAGFQQAQAAKQGLDQALLNGEPGLLGFTKYAIAAQTCATVMTNCYGSNQQYASFDECSAFVNGLNFGGWEYSDQNTTMCRFLHSLMTKVSADGHCSHTGISGGGMKCYDQNQDSYFAKDYSSCADPIW